MELDNTVKDVHPSEHTAYRSHKLALEVYAFVLRWFILVAEKQASKTSGDAIGPSSPKKGRGRGGKAASTTTAKGKKAAANKEAKAWEWQDSIAPTLALMGKVLFKVRTERIWQTTQEKDSFVG